MKRVLLTGMSGTGKSTVVEGLVALGHKAVDLDGAWCEPTGDGRRLWRESAVSDLLAQGDGDVLFVAGCEANMTAFLPSFDVVVLLTAPVDTLLERLATRTNNPFGRSAAERERVLEDLRDVEPLLRHAAHHVVSTTAPVSDVLTTVLDLAGLSEEPSRAVDDLFAGIAVRDYTAATAWYSLLFGAEPSFLPNEHEAVWTLGELRHVYIDVRPEHAGHSMQTVFVPDLAERLRLLAARGLHPTGTESYGNGVRKALFQDPDGNEIGLAGLHA